MSVKPDSIRTDWKKILAGDLTPEKQSDLLARIQEAARVSDADAEVSFGTSGWRGEIGSEFTFRNIQVVGLAILEMYKSADAVLLNHLGVSSYEDFCEKGIILGHDNRMLGGDFCRMVGGVLRSAGVRVVFGGEVSTPEFSAAVEMLGMAGAVNMTPSHNPANYAGIKFNPADGGPAGSEITSIITRLSNEIMQGHDFEDPGPVDWEEMNLLEVYGRFLEKQGTIDFQLIREFMASGDLSVVADSVHGSTRGIPEFLLGKSEQLTTLRTEDDVLFGGVAPEPSSANMAEVKSVLASCKTPFKLGAIYDPDGDRIRFFDGTREIEMNSFGAMAFHYMVVHRGAKGVVAKSVATSNFVNLIAAGLGVEVAETPVGFKNFRPWTKRGAKKPAIIAFEESDGISGLNNTIEKDAQFGMLLAIEMIARTRKNLGQYLEELQAEFGTLYPERTGFAVDREMTGAPLVAKVNAIASAVEVGGKIYVGSKSKTVREVLTLDGVKIIFEDDSWMLIRPSGTEPKVRIYAECRDRSEKEALFESAKTLFFSKD